ncbi:MAG: HEAT repeat domain-containing protein [Planctomycetota bacterium]|nr:HEAT repeat domain-containing protein [Planctomycetota bacterium]
MFVKGPEAFDPLTITELAHSRLNNKKGGFLIFQSNFDIHHRSKRSWAKDLNRSLSSLSKADRSSFLDFLVNEERRFRHCSSSYWKSLGECRSACDWLAFSKRLLKPRGTIEAAIALSNSYFLGGAEEPDYGAEIFASVWRSVFEKEIYSEDAVRDFFQKELDDRHWSCWAMKGPSSHLYVPFLIGYSCDENFAVRARIYRSLGQLAHPASVLCLREGVRDPHPLARYAAVVALGEVADFSFVAELVTIAKEDPVRRIRSAALRSLHRIEAYWRFFGSWRQIFRSSEKERSVVEELISQGLLLLDWDLRFGDADDPEDTIYPKVSSETMPFRADFRRIKANNSESKTLESMIRRSEASAKSVPESIHCMRIQLNSRDTDAVSLALCQASYHDHQELEADVEKLAESSSVSVQWHARRALRKFHWNRISSTMKSLAPVYGVNTLF